MAIFFRSYFFINAQSHSFHLYRRSSETFIDLFFETLQFFFKDKHKSALLPTCGVLFLRKEKPRDESRGYVFWVIIRQQSIIN